MKTERAKEIITSILQQTLIGQLDPSSRLNPRFVAEAIATKIDFEKPYNEIRNDILINYLVKSVLDYEYEMTGELDKLNEEEKLLANFIRGKITAYKEVLDIIHQKI